MRRFARESDLLGKDVVAGPRIRAGEYGSFLHHATPINQVARAACTSRAASDLGRLLHGNPNIKCLPTLIYVLDYIKLWAAGVDALFRFS